MVEHAQPSPAVESSLSHWVHPNLSPGLFTHPEIAQLERARLSVNMEQATAVLVSFENPFAKGGGIIAVMNPLASALKSEVKDVQIISPLHGNLKSAPDLSQLEFLAETIVHFGGKDYPISVYSKEDKGNKWILIQSPDFFTAGGDNVTSPYVYSDEQPGTSGTHEGHLMRDSLFLAKAVPEVMKALGNTKDLLFHLHDWQTAAAALTIKEAILDGAIDSAAVVLTSHNPYDCWLPEHKLAQITQRASQGRWNGNDGSSLETVYQRMIPLTDSILTTVSEGFANELTNDPLQTRHFAGHLQSVFDQQRIAGIGHGLFAAQKEVFTAQALTEAQEGKFDLILKEKLARRNQALSHIENYEDSRIIGSLKNPNGMLCDLDPSIPLFIMFGRMDPCQKGFDILCSAIQNMPAGKAKFFITPAVQGDVGQFMQQFVDLAESCPGDVTIFPFHMKTGYFEIMGGSSWAIMPSMYEPFGAATEPYVLGTPVVARATGGLINQVRDLNQDPETATGILFRERNHQGLDPAESWLQIQRADNPLDRQRNPMYSNMVTSLAVALTEACATYRVHDSRYGQILSNLPEMASTFSWENAAASYGRVYKQAVT